MDDHNLKQSKLGSVCLNIQKPQFDLEDELTSEKSLKWHRGDSLSFLLSFFFSL